MPTVMIAEDDLLMADMLSDMLVQNGYEVVVLHGLWTRLSHSASVISPILQSWTSGWPTGI